MARVVIENVTKTFAGPRGQSVLAVHHVHLTVEDKELLVLVGPSGSGKTTLLRLIAGLEEVTEGTIWIDGKLMNRVAPQDRDLALVFQNGALYPHLTAYENMALGLRLRKVSRSETNRRVTDAAAMLGLSACLGRKPDALSTGERQRVALGRALVRNPKVFLLDEPLSNLDALLRMQLRAEIAQLHQRLGATMIYVTHDQAEAITVGDRIAVMKDGAIQQVARPLEIYRRPANLFVAGFIGSPPMNFIPGTLVEAAGELQFVAPIPLTPALFPSEGERVSEARAASKGSRGFVASGILRLGLLPEQRAWLNGYLGQSLVLGLRPESLACSTQAPSNEYAFPAVVALVQPMGPETHLHVMAGGHKLIARVPADCRTEAGHTLTLTPDMRSAQFFDPATGEVILSRAK